MSTVDIDPRKAAGDSRQSLLYARDLTRMYELEKKRRKELEHANRKLASLVAAMADGVAVTDAAGRLLQMNPAFCAMTGKPEEAVLGEPLDRVLGVPDRSVLERGADQLEIRLEAGQRRMYSVLVSPLEGGEEGALYVFRDITSLHRAKELAEDFLALVSHELRTPLNGILGFSALLNEKLRTDDAEKREMAGYLRTSAKRMERIVNELLHYADLQYKRRQFPEELVLLPAVVEEVFSALAETAEQAGVRLRVRNLCSEPVSVWGWPSMIREMLYHVVHNGVVHGGSGRLVSVRLRCNSGQAEAEVMDKGPGVPASELEQVFEGFYQVEGHLTRLHDGLGLGLAMARRIADVHQARIQLRSVQGKGATVRITFPEPRSEAAPGGGA